MRPKRNCQAEVPAQRLLPAYNMVLDVHRVLLVGHENALIKNGSLELIGPNRQAKLKAKFSKMDGPEEIRFSFRLHVGAAVYVNGFLNWSEDHLAAQWRWQGNR